jgi:N-acetylgalactosamine-N,N'-diacetylbacillosaminyl-diphospho-undecaprenol 4-alpha-N-acetylgalactosaminyltransferase
VKTKLAKKMKPKVAILIHNMSGGGAERFVSHLLAGLKADFDIHLVLFDDTIEYALPSDQVVAYVERGFPGRNNLISIARLPLVAWRTKKYCDDNGIDLLISFLNRPNFTACLAKIAGLKIPLIISEQIHTPSWYTELDMRGKIAKRLVSWLYPRADIILPNSEGTRRALEEYYGIKTQYQVIRNITNQREIDQKITEAVDGINFDRFTFVNLASFSPQKGHRLMVEAFHRLGSKDAQLLFIGKGAKLTETRDLVASIGREKDILFLDHQSNPFKYLRRADCFVLASEFEGFPNVLTEAMACGLPVISTDCETGPRELLAPNTKSKLNGAQTIELGEFGVLVPVGNVSALAEAMQEMLENEDRRLKYTESGYSRVADFDAGVVVGHIRSIINEQLETFIHA